MSEHGGPSPESGDSAKHYKPNTEYQRDDSGRPLSHVDGQPLLPISEHGGRPGQTEALQDALVKRYARDLGNAKTATAVEAVIDDAVMQGLVEVGPDGKLVTAKAGSATRGEADGRATEWTAQLLFERAQDKWTKLLGHSEFAYDLGMGKMDKNTPDNRPNRPATPLEIAEAYAMRNDMEFAVGQAKAADRESRSDLADAARTSIDRAHERAAAAAAEYRQRELEAHDLAQQTASDIQTKVGDGFVGTEQIRLFNDPEADRIVRDELKGLIGREPEPAVVNKRTTVRGQRFTELVYKTARDRLVYVEQFSPSGQLLNRALIATPEAALAETRVRHLSKPTAALERSLAAQEVGLLPAKPDFDEQRRLVRREAVQNTVRDARGALRRDDKALSPATAGPTKLNASRFDPVVQSMEKMGYDDATIGAVTRGKRKPPRRRGFWGSLLGR